MCEYAECVLYYTPCPGQPVVADSLIDLQVFSGLWLHQSGAQGKCIITTYEERNMCHLMSMKPVEEIQWCHPWWNLSAWNPLLPRWTCNWHQPRQGVCWSETPCSCSTSSHCQHHMWCGYACHPMPPGHCGSSNRLQTAQLFGATQHMYWNRWWPHGSTPQCWPCRPREWSRRWCCQEPWNHTLIRVLYVSPAAR